MSASPRVALVRNLSVMSYGLGVRWFTYSGVQEGLTVRQAKAPKFLQPIADAGRIAAGDVVWVSAVDGMVRVYAYPGEVENGPPRMVAMARLP